jgi:hypothetical protein
MDATAEIHVALLEEGTSVWRPVRARLLSGDTYEILGIVPQDEKWQFTPGTRVRCKEHVFSGGARGLVAYEAVAP